MQKLLSFIHNAAECWFQFSKEFRLLISQRMCLKRNKLEQRPAAEWMPPQEDDTDCSTDWLRHRPSEPIKGWQQEHREIKHTDASVIKGKHVSMCTYPRTCLTPDRQLSGCDAIFYCDFQQADKVTLAWKHNPSMQQRERARHRRRQMRKNIQSWGEEVKEI